MDNLVRIKLSYLENPVVCLDDEFASCFNLDKLFVSAAVQCLLYYPVPEKGPVLLLVCDQEGIH